MQATKFGAASFGSDRLDLLVSLSIQEMGSQVEILRYLADVMSYF